jgi:hypothetical protein
MKNKFKKLLALIALMGLALVGLLAVSLSAKELQLEKANPPFTFQQFTNGIPAKEIKIPRDSKAEKEIFDWLKTNSKGWKITFLDYAPSKFIRGQNITVNFLKDGIILNFSPTVTSSHWLQYWKPTSKNDLEFLNELAKELGS